LTLRGYPKKVDLCAAGALHARGRPFVVLAKKEEKQMERHIAYMYELHKFMNSLAAAAQRRNAQRVIPAQAPDRAERFPREKVSALLSAQDVEDPEFLRVATRKLGVSLPPLANC
jgi:hypothetical protein